MKRIYYLMIPVALLSLGCNNKGERDMLAEEENLSAKKELQGIWIDENEGDATFCMKGDTVYFPDETSAPLYFRIEKDSFVLYGANVTKYPIVKQTTHLFEFENQNGEHVRLVKSNDAGYIRLFDRQRVVLVNQNKLIKRDTVVYNDNEKYHCYVQVNPTTYKVYRATCNDDGVEVDNVYYDNIVHLSIFHGSKKLYSSNVTKNDFDKQVSRQFLKQSVLSDMTFYKIDHEGIHCFAILGIPNSPSNFMVEFVVSYEGKIVKRIKN